MRLLSVVNSLIEDKDFMEEPKAASFMYAIREYLENGGKLEDMSWFKCLGLDSLRERYGAN